MIERGVILSNNEEVDIVPEKESFIESEDLRSIEKKAIVEALQKTGGNKKEAAKLLGISLRNLYYKIKDYGL